MDIKITNRDEIEFSIFQHTEIEDILKYAEKWAQISNDKKQNALVMENVESIRMSIDKWMAKYKLEFSCVGADFKY